MRSGCSSKDQGSLGKAWSGKHNPRHGSLALSTTVTNITIPEIITLMDIIIAACWNGPCATVRPCGKGKGAGGDLFTKGCLREAQKKEDQTVKLQEGRRWGTELSQPPSETASSFLLLPRQRWSLTEHGSADTEGRSKGLTQTGGSGFLLRLQQGCELPQTHTPPDWTDFHCTLSEELEDHAWAMPPCQSGHGCVPPVLSARTGRWGPACAFKGSALPCRKA